jgi:hypothetical protein
MKGLVYNGPRDQPFSAAICRSGACTATAERLLPCLRAATRRCNQGVLISSGCLLRAHRCQAPGRNSGTYLVVQPCDSDRQPHGAAVAIGPVISDADAEVVAEWLTGGDLRAARLDPRLRTTVMLSY